MHICSVCTILQSVLDCFRREPIQNMTFVVITPSSEQISHRRNKCDLHFSVGQYVLTSRTVFEQAHLRFINSILA